MRLRSKHIVIAVIGLIGGFFLLALTRTDQPVLSAPQVATGSEAGAIPAVGSNQDAVPKIEVSTINYDMGEISGKEVAKGSIDIFNRGGAPLEIKAVRTSCGCTVGKQESDIVPPGGSTKLNISVDPFKIPGFTSSKTLTITTNDPITREIDVQVSVHLKPEYSLEPSTVDFGRVSKGQPTERVLHMVQHTDEPLELKETKMVGPIKGVKAEFVKCPENTWKQPGKAEYDIKVRLDESVPSGPLNGAFLVITSLARLPRVRVQYSGIVDTFYTLSSPSTLRFSRPIRPGVADGAILTVSAPDAFELLGVQLGSEELVATVKPGEVPNSMQIIIGAKPTATPGVKRTDISFVVASPTRGSVKERLDVVGIVSKPE